MADSCNGKVDAFNSAGDRLPGNWPVSGFSNPSGVAVDKNGNVYVAEINNKDVKEFSSSGVYITEFGNPGSILAGPEGVAVDSGGNVWVTDPPSSRVLEYTAPTTYSKITTFNSGQSFNSPQGIAIAP